MTLTEFYNKVNPSVGVAQIVFNHLFKEFPVKKIKDVADTTSGGTPDRGNPEYWYGGKIPWIKSGETNDGLITQFEETITEKALANSSAKLFPKGTLLVAMYGATAGKTGILDFESTTNQALCAVFPNKLVVRDYLFWFFRQRRFGYLQESFGGAQPNISQTIIKDTIIPVPDLDTQREIVSFLEKCEENGELDSNFKFKKVFIEISRFFNYRSAYDALLLSQASQRSLLTALRQAILTEAVQGHLTPQWRKENPNQEHARELLKRIAAEKAQLIKEKKISKEKPLPAIKEEEVPYGVAEGWVWCYMQDLCPNISSGSTPPSQYWRDSGVPYLKVYNIRNQKIDFRYKQQYIDLDYHTTKSKRSILIPGDVIMNIVGPPLGKVAIIPDSFSEWNCNQAISFFKPIVKDLNEWMYSFLCEGSFLKDIELIGTAGQDNISVTKCKNIKLPLPPLPEQHAIVQKVNALLACCDELEQQVQQSKADLDLLMQSVLSEVFGIK